MLLRWLVLLVLITLLCHLGQAESFGTRRVGRSGRKQLGPGCGCSVVPSKGEIFFLSSLDAAGDWEKKGSYHTARSLVVPRVFARMRTGEAPLSGHT